MSRCSNIRFLLAVLVLWLANAHEHASQAQVQEGRGSLSGSVWDQTTREAIPDVNILLLGTYHRTATDERGNFSFQNLPPGNYALVVRHVAYRQTSRIITIDPGDTTRVGISLLGRAILLEPIDIVGESRWFELSSAVLGKVVTKKDISRYPSSTFSELLQAFIPTARIREKDGNLSIELVRASSIDQRYNPSADRNPLVILNGIKIGTVTAHLNQMLRPQEIERMEVITGPHALLYGMEGQNGVIIVDTISPQAGSRSDPSLFYFIGGVAGFVLFYLLAH